MSGSAGWGLGELFPEAGAAESGLRVGGLAFDSRKVKAGDAFVALAGSRADGARFIEDAVARGAVAVVTEAARPAGLTGEIAHLRVGDARRALSLAAARLHPRQPGTIVAVTGTSGKSSVAEFTRQIYAALGREAASLGTIGVVTAKGAGYGSLTTPDPLSLHASLDGLARDGITHLAMEASSHGLDQRRLDGVRLSAGAFLNLGHDHLDYHPDVQAYFAAKMRLWELLPRGSAVVLNRDSEHAAAAEAAARRFEHRIIGVGRAGETLKLVSVAREGFSQRLRVAVGGAQVETVLPLVGDFMAGNALVAAGFALATGEDAEAALAALSGLKGVPGRLERVGEARGALAVVDYAHKPDALAAVLATLKPYATGRLICVFGCGGDRDRAKRPLMGAIAAEKADIAIVTDDNPRSEDPAAIRAAIMAASPRLTEIGDRAEAIRAAVAMLRPGDLLVVAGKGHETGQIIGERTLPFSDHDAVRAAMAEIEG